MKLPAIVLVTLFLVGCGASRVQKNLIEFGLSTPDHLSDWQKLREELMKADIACNEIVSLGTISCFIFPDRFDRARSVAAEAIAQHSLTVRIRKESESNFFEVYEQGKKVNEEKYTVK